MIAKTRDQVVSTQTVIKLHTVITSASENGARRRPLRRGQEHSTISDQRPLFSRPVRNRTLTERARFAVDIDTSDMKSEALTNYFRKRNNTDIPFNSPRFLPDGLFLTGGGVKRTQIATWAVLITIAKPYEIAGNIQNSTSSKQRLKNYEAYTKWPTILSAIRRCGSPKSRRQ